MKTTSKPYSLLLTFSYNQLRKYNKKISKRSSYGLYLDQVDVLKAISSQNSSPFMEACSVELYFLNE